jgi:hypothetical protein
MKTENDLRIEFMSNVVKNNNLSISDFQCAIDLFDLTIESNDQLVEWLVSSYSHCTTFDKFKKSVLRDVKNLVA